MAGLLEIPTPELSPFYYLHQSVPFLLLYKCAAALQIYRKEN